MWAPWAGPRLQFGDKIFRFIAAGEAEDVLVIPPRYANDFKGLPDETLDFNEAVREVGGSPSSLRSIFTMDDYCIAIAFVVLLALYGAVLFPNQAGLTVFIYLVVDLLRLDFFRSVDKNVNASSV
jgi:hypothetical protein